MTAAQSSLARNVLNLTVIITSLGYFADFIDFFLFNILRVKSLTDLGLSGDALTSSGLFVSNCQLAGILIGAYLSGIMGDRIGRKQALFLSILVYALGSIACAFVNDVTTYGVLRFITGMGIAGELGTGITLIAERVHPSQRGYGAMIFISTGFLGALLAGLMAEFLPWRTCYMIGGCLGLSILALRVLLAESGMFREMEGKSLIRGGLKIILRDPILLKQYIAVILVITPGVFVPQIIFTLSPELAKGMGIVEPIKANIVFAIGFGVGILGDIIGIGLSEYLRSRKKAVGILMLCSVLLVGKHLFFPVHSALAFYVSTGLIGLVFNGWVVGVMWAAELFGTNIRATAATTVPNIARGLAIPMNLGYGALKSGGALYAAGIVGTLIFTLAALGWWHLAETHGKDLDYYERS